MDEGQAAGARRRFEALGRGHMEADVAQHFGQSRCLPRHDYHGPTVRGGVGHLDGRLVDAAAVPFRRAEGGSQAAIVAGWGTQHAQNELAKRCQPCRQVVRVGQGPSGPVGRQLASHHLLLAHRLRL